MEYRKTIECCIKIAEMELDEELEAKTSDMLRVWEEAGLELKKDIDSKELDDMKFYDCLSIDEGNLYLSILTYIHSIKVNKILEEIDKQ